MGPTPAPVPPPPLTDIHIDHQPPSSPYHLLQITLLSAQDLYPSTSSSMKSYVAAWAHPDHKHRFATSTSGHTSPTWNDKFVFCLHNTLLSSPTASINFDIYASRSKFLPGSDTLLGTARTLLSTLRPGSTIQFVALQVRRPKSLRPQGILQIGFVLLDPFTRSLPLSAEPGNREPIAEAVVEKVARSRSVREMEKKLEGWRVELPMAHVPHVHHHEEEEKRKISNHVVPWKEKSRRTPSVGKLQWYGSTIPEIMKVNEKGEWEEKVVAGEELRHA